ncbi:unnamed protein product [Boreogadus saida]
MQPNHLQDHDDVGSNTRGPSGTGLPTALPITTTRAGPRPTDLPTHLLADRTSLSIAALWRRAGLLATRAPPPDPVGHDLRQAPRVPAPQLSDDPDFSLKNRLILAALKASHHLANTEGPEPLRVVARLAESLRISIRPAVPNAATAQLYGKPTPP